MPSNNSPTNRNIRRAAALDRFKISSSGPLREGRTEDQQAAAAAVYVENKTVEKEALAKPDGRRRVDRKRGRTVTPVFE